MTLTPEQLDLAVRHCGDTYKACCLPWGWCHCICGDCRVAKYTKEHEHDKALNGGEAKKLAIQEHKEHCL
jgi:hypothetical protein